MINIRAIALVAISILAVDAIAGPEARAQKIELLSAEAQANAMLAGLQAEVGDWSKAGSTASDAKDALDKRTNEALEAANGHAELVRAVKEYIVAANAYFDAIVPSSSTPEVVAKAQMSRLKIDMDSKAKMLELELKTAGLSRK